MADQNELIWTLKQVSNNLNSKECPSAITIGSSQSQLLSCFYDYPLDEKTKIAIKAAADQLRWIRDNYQNFAQKYAIQRAFLNQIRWSISNIISDIKKRDTPQSK
jgi:hypothetical protein